MLKQPQRKTIRFRKGRSLEITASGAPMPILTGAITENLVNVAYSEELPSTKAEFTTALTNDSWNGSAVTEAGKMWDVLARCTQCLADNGLVSVP